MFNFGNTPQQTLFGTPYNAGFNQFPFQGGNNPNPSNGASGQGINSQNLFLKSEMGQSNMNFGAFGNLGN